MHEQITGSDRMSAVAKAGQGVTGYAVVSGYWEVEIYDPEGNLIYDYIHNLVVDEGLNELLIQALTGGTQTTTWYVGLIDSTPTVAAGDTMGSHSGWAEATGYDEAARQTWSSGAVSGQSVDNSGSPAAFTISSDSTTVGGAFLASDDTKGGTTGKLYAAGAFSGGDVTLSAGSTINVTATFTTAAA